MYYIMTGKKSRILDAWPEIREDLFTLMSDTDAWLIDELKAARDLEDWTAIDKIIDVMDSIHHLSHDH